MPPMPTPEVHEQTQPGPGAAGPAAPRVGLVLGGGGAVGAAYHAGVLSALQHDLGWDPRTAEVVVGTSAGALVGALLRLGVPPTDMAALHVGASAWDTHASLVDWHASRPPFASFGPADLLKLPRPPGPAALWALAGLARRRRLASLGALSVLLPGGEETMELELEAFEELLGGASWTEGRLLICATRRRDCHRVVFGAGTRRRGLARAIAASCAVPGYFRPVEIDGEAHVDGGVISATNADVLARESLDVAVVVSPMSGHESLASVSGLMRRLCRRALDHELARLHRAGIETFVIEPGPEVVAQMPQDFMDEEAGPAVLRESFLDAGHALRSDEDLRRLAGLLRSAAERVPT